MILSIIIAILCGVGIYGFYNGMIILTYVGMVAAILEVVIGIVSGELKSLSSIWFCVLLAIGATFAGQNFFSSLAICLCYENIIMWIAGIIFMIYNYKLMTKYENKDN